MTVHRKFVHSPSVSALSSAVKRTVMFGRLVGVGVNVGVRVGVAVGNAVGVGKATLATFIVAFA